jgi:hypothetical protein
VYDHRPIYWIVNAPRCLGVASAKSLMSGFPGHGVIGALNCQVLAAPGQGLHVATIAANDEGCSPPSRAEYLILDEAATPPSCQLAESAA